MSRTFFRKFFPAVPRAAGRKIEYYLARSAVSRTFFRKFFPAVPRAAGRPAFRASALRGGEFGIIRAPGAARAGNPPAHRMPTTPARWSGGGLGREGGIGWRLASPACEAAPQSRRFAPVHRHNRPGCPALARLGPPGRPVQPRVFNYLYISRRIGLTFRPGVLPPSSRKRRFPLSPAFPIRLRQTSHEANTSRDCFQQPKARRRVPSCNRP